MLPYVIIFGVVITIMLFASSKKVSPKTAMTLAIVVAVILSIFGGLRSLETGTDIGVYGLKYFKLAENSQDLSIYTEKYNDKIELGYLFVNYAIAKTTHSFSVFLTVLQLFTNIPIFIVIAKRKDKCNLALATTIYLLLFYCQTFNMMRQSIALSFCLLAIDSIANKEKFAAFSALAILFHSTALYYILLRTIIYILNNKNQKAFRKIMRFLFVASIAFIIFAPIFINTFYSNGLISIDYYNYISRFSKKNDSLSIAELFIYAILTTPIVASYIKKNAKESDKKGSAIIGSILYFSKKSIQYINRIAFYFQYEYITILPVIINKWKAKNTRTKTICTLALIAVLLSYWYLTICVWKWHEVYPYKAAKPLN